jgi:hypothetical protein
MKIKMVFCLAVFINCSVVKPCTIGVASGKVTADGRPMLWKTRDYEIKPNIIFYTQTNQYHFISNITPDYGFSESWFGLNNKGFAIVNSYIDNFTEGTNGLENGEFMFEALKSCATVKDFQNFLDSTNICGRKTKAIFGVIDTLGGAVIFEVNSNQYWLYDANDKSIAPDGYIVKTNFTIVNGGIAGIERYNRSSVLINNFYKGNNLTVKSILQYQMRDMADSEGNPIEFKALNTSVSYFNGISNICNPYSISATVIQGVKKGEPAILSTMWAMLGNPFASVAVPYWPVGQSPSISLSGSDTSLYGISARLKALLFDNSNRNYLNIGRAIKLQSLLFKAENKIYTSTNTLLNQWRKKTPLNSEMLDKEKRFAEYAYSKMLKAYKILPNMNK